MTMKPVKFKEHTVVYAENQPEYQPLPCIRLKENGQVTSCWRLSWRERLRVLFTGRIWCSELMFNNPYLTPIFLSTVKGEHFVTAKAEKKYFFLTRNRHEKSEHTRSEE